MKISERQLLFLLDVAKNTLSIVNNIGGYDRQARLNQVNTIINQQDDTVKDVGELEDITLLANLDIKDKKPS